MKKFSLKKLVSFSAIVVFIILSVFINGGNTNRNTYAYDEVNAVAVHVYYDEKETIILQDNQKNYPEVAFITLVATEPGPKGRALYGWGWNMNSGQGVPTITVEISYSGNQIDDRPYIYELYELKDRGLILSVLEAQKDNFQKWEGLYKSFEDPNNLKGVLVAGIGSDGKDPAGPQTLRVLLNKENPYRVIAVLSWNYERSCSNLKFKLANIATYPLLDKKSVSVKLNIDNVDFIRTKAEEFVDNGGKIKDFRGEPGIFVVRGTKNLVGYCEDRTYANIIKIKMVEAKKEIPPLPQGGVLGAEDLDWIQVAATDIYNSDTWNKEVFDCVWEVKGRLSKRFALGFSLKNPLGALELAFSGYTMEDALYYCLGGQASLSEPYRIYLNPYHKVMRFNCGGGASPYGFTNYKWRTTTIYHEALHGYRLLNRYFQEKRRFTLPLFDSDKDDLVVGEIAAEAKNKYFTYAHDHYSRGFLNYAKAKELIKWYCHKGVNVAWGDTQANNNKREWFVTKVDDLFTLGGGSSLNADAPADFPVFANLKITGLFLYNSNTDDLKEVPNPVVTEKIPVGPDNPYFLTPVAKEIEYNYNKYLGIDSYVSGSKETSVGQCSYFGVKFLKNKDLDDKYLFWMEKGYSLYAICCIEHVFLTEEFDAEMFAITLGR